MLDNLNPSQRAAVLTTSGPLLVLAGAGSGKTRVVTVRIARLIAGGTPPERILAVTFTNKAAREMRERALALLGKKMPSKPEISTFHSLCVRILRRHITRLGFPAQYAIYDRGDQESVARAALREVHVASAELRPSDLLAAISRWKTSSIGPADAARLANSDKGHLAAAAYRRYQQSLKLAGALDFDDLLMFTEELFEKFADARRAEASRFDHVLVDEYQDTNGSQYRIIKALAERHRNLCVVGDDDQSIYGWRGAEVTHILNFQRDWPEASVVRLEENYRSTGGILEMANRLIAYNRTRHDKVLRAVRQTGDVPRIVQYADEVAESKQVVEEIRAQLFGRLAEPRDFAILFRTNEQPRAFEAELRKARLPYTLIGSMSFYDRKEVRDILAYLKVLQNPSDEVSLLRIINTPARGITPKTVTALQEHAISQGLPMWEILHAAPSLPKISTAALAALDKFRGLVGAYQERLARQPLVDVVADLIHSIKYQEELHRIYQDPTEQIARWNSVQEVVNSLAAYQKQESEPTLGGFLDDVALTERDSPEDKESKLTRNAIILMTLHSAKGLEFSQVYLVGMEEGLLPHSRAITENEFDVDEERRLCYVGVTRAQDRLTLTFARTRTRWGKSRDTTPSRFLFELTGKAERAPAARLKPAGTKPANTEPAGEKKRAGQVRTPGRP